MTCASTSRSDGDVGGNTTSRPPLSSGPQISSVAGSNEMGATWRNVSPALMSTKAGWCNRRITARCSTATPLGRPVLPEVKSTYARWRERTPEITGAVRRSAAPSSSTKTDSTPCGRGTASRIARVVSTHFAGASSSIAARRGAG
nr:hypothetical protein [Corallococcus sp. CA049B]